MNYHYQNTTTVKTIRREVRQRGFFGWVFLVIFWLWNAFMLWGLWAGLTRVGPTAGDPDKVLGTAIGVGILLAMWALGAFITGLLAYFTRGPKTIIEETIE